VVGQQLSIASATAIWSRLEAAIVPLKPERLLYFDDEALRQLGLSRSKAVTIRTLANALERGDLDIAMLNEAEDARVHELLTGLRGFGPWSADIYIMFCLGRRDGFAAGDLALQEGARTALGLERRPTPAELLEISARWRPWRGVAAGLLWSHYAFSRKIASAFPA
jgi:DNA-3-methyladenine glycosylase II